MPVRFAFRQIDRRDLQGILADGEIRCKTHPVPQQCYQASHSNIVGFRGTPAFHLPHGGVVNDYVQFYFSPVTAYSFAIHRGAVDVKNPQGEVIAKSSVADRIFLVARVSDAFRDNPYSCFSDYALNSLAPMPTVITDLAMLPAHVKWSLFDDHPMTAQIPEIGYAGVCQYFADQPAHADRQHRKSARMAELLVKHSMATSTLCAIVVPSQEASNQAFAVAGAYNFNGLVIHRPGCFVG